MPDSDPYASIAIPIQQAAPPDSAPPRMPLRNPRIPLPAQSSDPYAAIAIPISSGNAGAPNTLSDTTPMADPGAGKPYVAPPSPPGVGHQVLGAVQGAGEAVGGAAQGLYDLFQGPQTDNEKDVHGKLGRLGLAGYRLYHGLKNFGEQGQAALEAGRKEKDDTGSWKAGLLTELEQDPITSNFTKLAEGGEYGKATGGALANYYMMKGGAKGAKNLPEVAADARAAIPEAPVIAGTKLPETVGQAASRANPSGIGSDVKGLEDIASKMPGSERLRAVKTGQQEAARTILANKLTDATGAVTSAHPEAIEENIRAAVEKTRQSGNAKYQEIGKAAATADMTKPVQAAHDILTDESLAKLLPKSARDALGKVASSLGEQETIARQIYGKAFSDLDTAQQAEVGRAAGGAGKPAGIQAALDARSELGSAANRASDAADARLLHMAHEQFGQAINDTLGAHDPTLVDKLAEADKTWSQKYAFETFLDKAQSMMRDKPHSNAIAPREIDGADWQTVINDLDPRGSSGKTPLQRMFPGDPQSVKDLHDLADFMGTNQRSGGSMAATMGKMRLLGLKESALGLLVNTIGFSSILSKPGLARAILTAMKGGKDVAKISAAIGEINHAASPDDRPITADQAKQQGRVVVQVPGQAKQYHFPDQQSADAFKYSAGIQ